MKHFLDINKTNVNDLNHILDQAKKTKATRAGFANGANDIDQTLSGKMVALIFEKPSTRTRVSFDMGVRQMGGQTMVLSGAEMQIGHGESIADTARVLSRYVDMIMIRTFAEATLLELAEYSTVPVINGLTDRSHPCQIMADIMTFQEKHGSISGKKVVWLGDGNNVCTSFLHAAGKFGFNLTFAGPEVLDPETEAMGYARSNGSTVEIERDASKAVKDADLIVTDTWLSMHDDQAARARRHNLLRPYQVNSELMKLASKDAIFMHCLPAHREEEVTSEVMDGTNSVVFDEAENRLHVQKAIMQWCLDK
ncbi:ornithine carbamoyltransferase [Amylibacter sp.]|nr:ornithine carbamoyltransferase [Amylibacter sp.]MDA9788636.1 ornithine carbamoyltransferase [Amylibacter sp.]